MKLRNKKTGEIVEANDFNIIGEYKNLADLTEEWEDYEEPQYTYWIDTTEERITQTDLPITDECLEYVRELGLGFATREEAERAVEKLKAWKRLKDKGFVWQGWEEGAMDNGMCVIGCQIPENNWETDVVEDLALLFGGEEPVRRESEETRSTEKEEE